MRKIAALAFAFSLALAAPAQAAIALVASSNGVAAGNVPAVTGKNWAGATLGLACVSADISNGSGQTVSFTAGSTGTWTRQALENFYGAFQVELWTTPITSAASGTGISYSGNFAKINVAAFSGTAASPLDGSAAQNHQAFASSMQPGSITPSQNGDLLAFCGGLSANGGSTAIDSSFSILDDSATGGCCNAGFSAYYVQPTAGAINPTWSSLGGGSTVAYAIMQAIKDNSGGGGPAAVPLRGLLGVGQ